MVSVNSTMLPLGSKMPAFELADPAGEAVLELDRLRGTPALVMFICNHCPYVKHIRPRLAEVSKDLAGKGLAVVGINSNDAELYPDDSPEAMKAEGGGVRLHLPLPGRRGPERGQGLPGRLHPGLLPVRRQRRAGLPRPVRHQPAEERRSRSPATTWRPPPRRCWRAARSPEDQRPSIGCNIKWKPGNEPDYFG